MKPEHFHRPDGIMFFLRNPGKNEDRSGLLKNAQDPD